MTSNGIVPRDNGIWQSTYGPRSNSNKKSLTHKWWPYNNGNNDTINGKEISDNDDNMFDNITSTCTWVHHT